MDTDRGKVEDASRVVTEEVEVKGKTAMDLYVTLGPPASSLKALSSSKALRRPGKLGGQLRE